MLTLDEITELPEDPELAFVEYEKKLKEWLDQNEYNHGLDWELRQKYYNHVRAFHDAQNLSFLSGYEEPYKNNFETTFRKFTNDIEYTTAQISIAHATRLRSIRTAISLDTEAKQSIREYLEKIKRIVEPLDIPVTKKDKIFSRINALANEIDQEKTKSEALMALTLEVANTGGEVAKKLMPVKEIVDSVTDLIATAKEKIENPTMISGPKEVKKLEPPEKFKETPASNDDSDKNTEDVA